ncbi:hypothetical protein ONE56_12580 [Vibrio mytili]
MKKINSSDVFYALCLYLHNPLFFHYLYAGVRPFWQYEFRVEL